MAKITLTFKGKPIRAYHFEAGSKVFVGRNDSNGIIIDSLAVAPVHAEIEFGNDESKIASRSTEFPLEVNNVKVQDQTLKNGDKISVGKHLLFFAEDSTLLETAPAPQVQHFQKDLDSLNLEIKQNIQATEAQLQIMSGKNIGRVISLKGGLNRLGKSGSGVAVVVKRKDGYYTSALEGDPRIKINGSLINDKSVKLEDGDLLEIEKTEMQFFICENA